MPIHTVVQGDTVASIAFEHGFFTETIWNHNGNADLRTRRQHPNILFPGDEVFIPETQVKYERAGTDRRHRYVRRGVPEMLRLRLLDTNQDPRAEVPYVLVVDRTTTIRGQTDSEGRIECRIPPNASRCTLRVGAGDRESYQLNIGHLDPIAEISGLQGRLANMGFFHGRVDGQMGAETSEAIREFQRKCGLTETGELDDATRDELRQSHES